MKTLVVSYIEHKEFLVPLEVDDETAAIFEKLDFVYEDEDEDDYDDYDEDAHEFAVESLCKEALAKLKINKDQYFHDLWKTSEVLTEDEAKRIPKEGETGD